MKTEQSPGRLYSLSWISHRIRFKGDIRTDFGSETLLIVTISGLVFVH